MCRFPACWSHLHHVQVSRLLVVLAMLNVDLPAELELLLLDPLLGGALRALHVLVVATWTILERNRLPWTFFACAPQHLIPRPLNGIARLD